MELRICVYEPEISSYIHSFQKLWQFEFIFKFFQFHSINKVFIMSLSVSLCCNYFRNAVTLLWTHNNQQLSWIFFRNKFAWTWYKSFTIWSMHVITPSAHTFLPNTFLSFYIQLCVLSSSMALHRTHSMCHNTFRFCFDALNNLLGIGWRLLISHKNTRKTNRKCHVNFIRYVAGVPAYRSESFQLFMKPWIIFSLFLCVYISSVAC